MSKRNIRGKSGKQLYLNQLFLGGMKYTSSEMTEGVAKVISNYDISPTGDSAMPRTAFTSKQLSDEIGKYFYPIKFNQAVNEQHYIEFVNTVSEEDYIGDVVDPVDPVDTSNAPIKFYSRTIGDILEPTKTIGGSFESEATGTTEDLERTFDRAVSGLDSCTSTDLENNGFSVINSNNFRVYDGDTFTQFGDYTGKVRLLGIDCPEIDTRENWSYMSRAMLQYIVDTLMKNSNVYYKDYGLDKYDRRLLDVYIKIWSDYFNLSEIMVRCGLANPAYFYNEYPIQSLLLEACNAAKEDELCLHSNEIDPFLVVAKNLLLEDYDYSHTKYRYEFVRTTDSKAVNSLLTNTNDKVQFQYIDYQDSIGILGRILDSDSSIIYKGLMYIKPVIISDNLNFTIELPPNNLEGDEIDIVTAQETGYNLLNSKLIDLTDSNDEYLVAGIKGLVVTDPTNADIVMTAVRGQAVNLHAIMNYGYINPVIKPIVSYQLYAQITKEFDSGKQGVPKKEITNQIYNISGSDFTFTISPDTSSEHLLAFTIKFTGLDVVVTNGEVTHTIDISDRMRKVKHYFTVDDLKNYFNSNNNDYDGDTLPTDIGNITVSVLKDTFSSMQYTPTWDSTANQDQILYADIQLTNIPIIDTFDTKVFGKWEKAKYGADLEKDEGWTIISEREAYTIEDNILKPLGDNPEDITWTVDELSNISLRYTIYANQYLIIKDDVYPDYPFRSKTYDITLAMPLFKISHTQDFLNQSDILNNINIKDATRIGIFNRQLYLYGPKTKSNYIQFSMFEKEWYLPFPFYNIEIPEPIIYVYSYRDSLVVFGKYNIYMLTGGPGVLELSLHKIYENLSITAADINLVNTVGTSLMFFNNNIGYLIVPNTYSDDPTNIKVYKFTDNISNALLNPEPLIKSLTNYIGLNSFASTIFANYVSYIDSNVLYIAANYKWTKGTTEYKTCIIYRYNQTYKYWNIYHSKTFTELNNAYISEPQLGLQFITSISEAVKPRTIHPISRTKNVQRLTFLNQIHLEPVDVVYRGESANSKPIETYLDSGYLSVDTMNDKRFKDIIIEFDNIKRYKGDSSMEIHCNFFIDGTPMLISEPNNIQVENQEGVILGDIEPHVPLKEESYNTVLHHITDEDKDSHSDFVFDNTYGVAFKLDDKMYSNVGRTHVRIPIFGKGRLPSFTLRIVTQNNYEFINYSLIYKEKNINRRR